MLKRRFYKLERADEQGSIESSSDYEPEQGIEESEECSSELKTYDSVQVDDDPSDHVGLASSAASESFDGTDSIPSDKSSFIFKSRSAFRCKICPKVVRLNEETVTVHLKSKGHARSERLLKEGKLKSMLNSDGEAEEDQETHSERHFRILKFVQTEYEIGNNPKGMKHRKASKKNRRKK